MIINRLCHPKKEIEDAIQYAESYRWRYQKSGRSAHAWGRLLCPLEDREGCKMSLWSTPRDAENHARQIRHRVDSCSHCGVRFERLMKAFIQ